MIRRQFLIFILRWLASSLLMFICIRLFGGFTAGSEASRYSLGLYLVAGLIFALVNTIVRPIATIIALPFLYLTMGFFTIVLNIAMVALTMLILPTVTMSFWGAFWSCILISLLNLLVNLVVSDVK